MNGKKSYDLVIIGAGPAGMAAAISLKDSGLKIALLEKNSFPKDKICGDALSPDILNQLQWIDPELRQKLENLERKTKCSGVLISTPSGESCTFTVPWSNPEKANYGYVVRRKDFDQLLFDWLKEKNHVDIYENCSVSKVEISEEKVETETNEGTFESKMIFGADGAHSMVKKQIQGTTEIERDYHAAALRVYYKGVTGLSSENIELHFVKGVVPGYFWIFPLSENEANVGIGILSSFVAKKKLNLKKILNDIIENNPDFKSRFANAEPLETIKGYGLPLGGKKRSLSGNRYLLLGDAAAIIDPATGEGIGNAIRSGRFAAQHFEQAIKANDFTSRFNLSYDKRLYAGIMKELKVSRMFQKALSYPWILNAFFRKINRSKEFNKYFIEKVTIFKVDDPFFVAKFALKFLFGK